jgi:hypothetical protein
VARLATPGSAVGVAVSGAHAYVADATAVVVVEISDPLNPEPVGSVDTPSYASGTAVSGTQLYVADALSGLLVLPSQCEDLTPVSMLSFTASLAPVGVLLEWTTGAEEDHLGFHVYRRAAGFSWERITKALVVGGPKYAYTDGSPAAGRYEYEVESLSRAGETERFGPVQIEVPVTAGLMLAALANPTWGTAGIRYALPVSGPASLRVFDPSGRLVRVLVDGIQTAGPGEVTWDVRDEAGQAVPAGVYFYQLRTLGKVLTNKLVILPAP